jgi:hypothetical protein
MSHPLGQAPNTQWYSAMREARVPSSVSRAAIARPEPETPVPTTGVGLGAEPVSCRESGLRSYLIEDRQLLGVRGTIHFAGQATAGHGGLPLRQ